MAVDAPLATQGGGTSVRRRGRIVVSLFGVLLVVALGPLVAVSWKLIDTNREALKTSQQQYQLLLAASVARQIDAHVEALRSQLVRVARTLAPVVGRAEAGDGQTRRLLADVADDRMPYVRYADLRGWVVDSRADGGLPREIEARFLEERARVLEAMAAAGQAGTGVPASLMSRPFWLSGWAVPRAAVVVSTPVALRGKFRGVLSALVDCEALWDSVARHYRGGHVLFLADGTGRVVAASDPQRFEPGASLGDMEIVRRFLSARGRATETAPFYWAEHGRPVAHLGSYERTQLGWGLFVLARESQVYAPVRAMIHSTLSWSLVAIALALAAAIVFAGTLSTPIQRLAAAARAFAAGDFATRVRVASRNELGELAEVFNRMAAKIEDDIRELRRAAEENNELFLGTIRALAQAIDAKDPYTRGHSVRVNKYSVIVGRYLGLSEEELKDLHVASLLHDVGKIGVDDAILKKPGALSPEEFELMKSHTVLGANIMAPIPQMRRIIPGLRSHHERMNGSGYPDGLKGDAIPVMARIIAVADTFDAMTTHRPYQQAMRFEAALARINELKGVVLDERVVEAFNRAFHAGEFQEEQRAVEGQAQPVHAS